MTTQITKIKSVNELREEITKLKKSREVLRKAVEFYGNEDSWNWSDWNRDLMSNFEDGELKEFEDKHDNHFLAGKKAREAIKADDDIMKGKGI